MKTSEFKKKVEELSYDIEISEVDVFIKYDGYTIARISRTSPYTMSVYAAFRGRHAKELFDLCVEYARTPIKAREEEEKFYLQKMKSFYDTCDEEYAFLNLDMDDNTFFLSDVGQYDNSKTQFTQKEIDKIKEEQHTDLSEFKQIPVEEIDACIE